MKKFFADITAMIVFSTIVGMIIELLISRLTFEQSIQVRLVAVPVNFITARPYGLYRDWILKIFNAKTGIKKSLFDIISFSSFQVVIYATNLKMAHSTWNQIFLACGTLILISLFIGRPYGIFLDFIRRLFKIQEAV